MEIANNESGKDLTPNSAENQFIEWIWETEENERKGLEIIHNQAICLLVTFEIRTSEKSSTL